MNSQNNNDYNLFTILRLVDIIITVRWTQNHNEPILICLDKYTPE